MKLGSCIALFGVSIYAMIGEAGERKTAITGSEWFNSGKDAIEQRALIEFQRQPAKNIILFIGDGMGVATVTASRIYDGQSRGEQGEENNLSFEKFPHLALVKTYNTNQQVSDSAGTASAMHTGVKTRAGVLGISHEARRKNCKESLRHLVPVLGELAEQRGLSTGIVSNMRVTHATPAAVYAHTPERDWERDSLMPVSVRESGSCEDIASQLVNFSYGDGLDVIFGGGRENFLGEEYGGKRFADENLITEWQDESSSRVFISTADELASSDLTNIGQVMGLFSDGHLSFVLDRKGKDDQPSLSEMTGTAIDLLSRNDRGFYLMVEGGHIDKGHHSGIAEHALAETQELSNAIAVALSKVDLNETLILVTADHSHVMTMGGYPTRGNPILGLVVNNNTEGESEGKPAIAEDGYTYTTLGYQNGPGAIKKNRLSPDVSRPLLKQQALIPTSYHSSDSVRETHGGEDVALYAIGPRSHLVGGVIEQHFIFHIIANSFGWRY